MFQFFFANTKHLFLLGPKVAFCFRKGSDKVKVLTIIWLILVDPDAV